MNGNNPLDMAALLAALFTAWLGPRLGPVIGIYSVIVIASIVGAGFALARREPSAKLAPGLFMLLMVLATLIATVPITLLLVPHLPEVTVQVAAPVVALLVGAVGHDWERVGGWVWEQRLRFLPAAVRRADDAGGPKP